MLHCNTQFLVCNIIIYLYISNVWRQPLIIVYTHSNAQCPIVFEERPDIELFNQYCKQMAFSLSRIGPDRYRGDICYSKCMKSAACIYFKYDDNNARCIVCLRPVSQFANPKVGIEVEEYNDVYSSVFARIGIEFNVSACDFLDYTCSTRWFGLPDEGYNRYEIENIEQISSLQFCEHGGIIGGFIMTFDTNVSYSIGCDDNYRYYHMRDKLECSANELITGVYLAYSEYYLYGIQFHTNEGNVVQDMRNAGSSNDNNHCMIQRGDFVGIEVPSEVFMDSIRFQFSKC